MRRVDRKSAGRGREGDRETTGRLAHLAAGRSLATADRIADARRARDGVAAAARRDNRAPEASPQVRLAAHVAEFERLKGEADRLTDEAIEDAARLAGHRLEAQRLDEQTRRYALAQAAEARAAATSAETEQNWRELWKHVCICPRSPARMREWSSRIEQLMKTRDKLAARHRAEVE